MTEVIEELSPADPAFWRDGHALARFESMRRETPLLWHEEPRTEWFPDGGRGFWSLVRYEDVVAVSKDQTTFTSALGTEIVDMPSEMQHIFGGMLNMSGDEHARNRAIVNRVLTPRTVDAMTENIRRHARGSIIRVAELGHCDFMTDIVGDFPAQIICELLGVPPQDRRRLIELTTTALAMYGTAESYRAVLDIIAYAQDLIDDARTSARETGGFLRKLLDARVDGQSMSDHEIAVFFALLATAGIETTTTTIGQGMRALLAAPAQRRAWQDDFDGLVGNAVEEIIRWATPVMHFRRTATRDIEMHDQLIRSGDKVVLWYISANRDTDVIDHPDELDFQRPDRQHVSFGGGGPHFCLGAVLARKEITVFFRELFDLLPDINVCGDPKPVLSNFVNGLETLPVSYTPRAAS